MGVRYEGLVHPDLVVIHLLELWPRCVFALSLTTCYPFVVLLRDSPLLIKKMKKKAHARWLHVI